MRRTYRYLRLPGSPRRGSIDFVQARAFARRVSNDWGAGGRGIVAAAINTGVGRAGICDSA
jgi:hypothetical protein